MPVFRKTDCEIEPSANGHRQLTGLAAKLAANRAILPVSPEAKKEPAPGLNTRRLSEVQSRPVEWQRYSVTALGKTTLVSGPPGVGKTWFMLEHIARHTTHRNYPGVKQHRVTERDEALFVSLEDADDDTIRPRIEAMHGDVSRVHTLQFVFEADSSKEQMLQLDRHVQELDDWLTGHPKVELVVLDPISAVLGRVDSHRDAEVRGVLGPVAKLAERHRIAVVYINHLNKASEGMAIYRSIGSIGFMASVRIAWHVCEDRKNPGRSLFLPVKMNLCKRPHGLAFRITDSGLCWDKEPVTITADEALKTERATKRDEAEDWLRKEMKPKKVYWAAQLFEKADKAGFSKATLHRASEVLGVVKHKRAKGWEWQLPSPKPQKP